MVWHQLRFCFSLVFLLCLTEILAQSSVSQHVKTGMQWYAQGYYDSAATYLMEDFSTADSLNPVLTSLLGEALAQAGKVKEAQQVIDTLSQWAAVHQDVYYQTKALQLTGDLHLRTGQLPLAQEAYQKAEQTYTVHEPDSMSASLRRRLGFTLFSMGQYDEARQYAQQAYATMVTVLPGRHQDWADYYKLLGAIHDRQAQFDSALSYYHKSLEVYLEKYGEQHPETAKLWVNLANVYHVRGANVKASQLFNRALETLQTFFGKDHMLIAVIYNNMGIIDFDMGNFEKAIIYYQHALNIFQQKTGRQSLQVAQIQNNIASAYLEMNNPEKALPFAFQSLEIRKRQLEDDNPMLAPVYVNLAGAYIQQHAFAKANRYSNQAIQIFERQGATDHPVLAESYTGLGESYLSQQQLNKALSFLFKAKKISLRLYGAQHAKLAYIENKIGEAFQQMQQWDSALYHYDLAIQAVWPAYQSAQIATLPKINENSYIAQHFLFDALGGRAATLFMQYQAHPEEGEAGLLKAYELYNYLSRLIDGMRNAYQREESKLFLSKMATPVYDKALEVAWMLYKETGQSRYAAQAFSFSEKSKYALLSDFLNDIAAKYTAAIPKAILEQEQHLKSQISYYEKQLLETTNDSLKKQYEPQLAALKKEYLDFATSLEKEYPQYYQLKYNPKTATVEEVQRILQEDEQLIEYALADSSLYVFAIRKDSIRLRQIIVEEPLEETVMQMRQGLLSHDFGLYTQYAWQLYEMLAEEWKEQGQKMIIIPDGVLGYIPFEILLTKKVDRKAANYWQLPFLIKDHVISYNFSATLYLSEVSKAKSFSFQSFMVGFAPAFSSDSSMLADADTLKISRNKLLHLQGAQRELRKIAEIFQGKFYFDQEATEANFKKATHDSRLIHLGTHGILNDDNPDLSYLVFSHTKEDSLEDNLLHTYEIYNLNLNAELVTLSACNTGTGQLREGEGVMSLARGFAYAGCPNVVTSLWAAPDQATAQLMQSFYYYLKNGWEKDEALHQAKLDFLANADENLANPYYWGSFILVGDAQPLQLTNYRWLVWLLSLVSVLILVWLFYRKYTRIQSRL